MKPYVSLHTHSDRSSFDGFGSPEDFARVAAEQGAPALCLTEHGSMRSAHDLHVACGDHGIKPLFGVEAYLCPDMHRKGLSEEELADLTKDVPRDQRSEVVYQEEKRLGLLDRYHVTLIAETDVGLRNLFELTSRSWIEGYHKRPRLDLPTLMGRGEGIIVLSGCPSGICNRALAEGDIPSARAYLEQMRATFGDRFYAEVMPHVAKDEQPTSRTLVDLADELGIRVVATQDAHYPGEHDWQWQETMLAIRTQTALINRKRFRFDAREYWMRTRDEVTAAFLREGQLSPGRIEAALDETLAVAERCTARLPVTKTPLLPELELPEGRTEAEHLRALCREGWRKRGLGARLSRERQNVYAARCNHELAEIERRGIVRYFLIVHDVYRWMHEAGVCVGPGRGSSAGSLVAYLLFITDVDPIEHGLMFERFLAPGRNDLPDIDCDVGARDRGRIIEWIVQRYGRERVAQIGTIGTLLGRGALKDVAKTLLIPLDEVEQVSPWIEEAVGDDRVGSSYVETMELAHKGELDEEALEPLIAFDLKYPQVRDYVAALEGTTKTLGLHAAGVVIGPSDLRRLLPIETRSSKGEAVPVQATGITMDGVADLGLLKLDILSVKNLHVLDDTLAAVRALGFEYEKSDMPLDDPDTLQGFSTGLFAGIFQYDTCAMRRMCNKLAFRSFADVVAMLALVRPGTSRSEFGKLYFERLRDGGRVPRVHPVYDQICADTLGVPVYQEQFIALFRDLAGYSAAEADAIRKKCAKKHGAKAVLAEAEKFVRGCSENGMRPEVASKLLKELSAFAAYSFNKSHAVAYALTSFRQMFLKLRHPGPFFAALLSTVEKATESGDVAQEVKLFELEVRAPSVNNVSDSWVWDDAAQVLLSPVSLLKGVGPAAVEALRTAAPFADINDFIARVPRKAINVRVATILLGAGALDALCPAGVTMSEDELRARWANKPAAPAQENA